jgi:hypothetical protein
VLAASRSLWLLRASGSVSIVTDVPKTQVWFHGYKRVLRRAGKGERETVLAILQAECEVLIGRPEDYLPY